MEGLDYAEQSVVLDENSSDVWVLLSYWRCSYKFTCLNIFPVFHASFRYVQCVIIPDL